MESVEKYFLFNKKNSKAVRKARNSYMPRKINRWRPKMALILVVILGIKDCSYFTIGKFTNSMNSGIKSISSNCWTWFKFHKHLVAWNWDLGLFVIPSDISYKVCIFTSSFINLDIFKSTLKLLSKGKCDRINFIFQS